MTRVKQGTFILFLFFVLLGFTELTAGERTSRARFERISVLEYVDFAARQAMIDGRIYSLAPDMEWQGIEPGASPESQRANLYKRRVGYVLGNLEGRVVITAIWVLPRDER